MAERRPSNRQTDVLNGKLMNCDRQKYLKRGGSRAGCILPTAALCGYLFLRVLKLTKRWRMRMVEVRRRYE